QCRFAYAEQSFSTEAEASGFERQPLKNETAVRHIAIVAALPRQPVAAATDEQRIVGEPAGVRADQLRCLVIDFRHIDVRRDEESAMDPLDDHRALIYGTRGLRPCGERHSD